MIAGILIIIDAAIRDPHLTPNSSMKNASPTEIVLSGNPFVIVRAKRNSFQAVINTYQMR